MSMRCEFTACNALGMYEGYGGIFCQPHLQWISSLRCDITTLKTTPLKKKTWNMWHREYELRKEELTKRHKVDKSHLGYIYYLERRLWHTPHGYRSKAFKTHVHRQTNIS